MSDENTKKPHDDAVEKELEGVPEQFLESDTPPEGEDVNEGLDSEAVDMSSEIAALTTELEEVKQNVLYARAETQNVRRRLEKDVQDARNYAATGFARDILSVADNLARAIEHVPAELRENEQSKRFIEGIEATQRELEKVFGQHGISRIAAVGLPLDPNQHQAMMEVPTDEHEAGTIVQEMQAGYMIKDRLLRPAMVGVAKKPD